MHEGDDLCDYLAQFMEIVDKLDQMGININDDLLSFLLLPAVEILTSKIIAESITRRADL